MHARRSSVHLVGVFRLASFILGAAVIIDALLTHAATVQWVAGLLLVGIVPPEAVVNAWRKRR